MKNNEIVSALVGWTIVGVAYIVGRKHGYNKKAIIEDNKKKEEES